MIYHQKACLHSFSKYIIFCVFCYCAVLRCARIIKYMAEFACLKNRLPHYHYADLLEGIGLLKCLSGTFCLECVSEIKWIISIICLAVYGTVRIQLTHFFYNHCETCTLSYYHHQIGSMTNLPLRRARSWSNGTRCMSFCILIRPRFKRCEVALIIRSPNRIRKGLPFALVILTSILCVSPA